jgi:hypothetical protein
LLLAAVVVGSSACFFLSILFFFFDDDPARSSSWFRRILCASTPAPLPLESNMLGSRSFVALRVAGFPRLSSSLAAAPSTKNLLGGWGRGYVTKGRLLGAKIVEVVPALGESITEGSIAKWSKNVGDRVNVDDVVVVVETDKVTVDIKSTNAGVLTAQLATDTVSVSRGLTAGDDDAPSPSSTGKEWTAAATGCLLLLPPPCSRAHVFMYFVGLLLLLLLLGAGHRGAPAV